jgi:hypothetical protein
MSSSIQARGSRSTLRRPCSDRDFLYGPAPSSQSVLDGSSRIGRHGRHPGLGRRKEWCREGQAPIPSSDALRPSPRRRGPLSLHGKCGRPSIELSQSTCLIDEILLALAEAPPPPRGDRGGQRLVAYPEVVRGSAHRRRSFSKNKEQSASAFSQPQDPAPQKMVKCVHLLIFCFIFANFSASDYPGAKDLTNIKESVY